MVQLRTGRPARPASPLEPTGYNFNAPYDLTLPTVSYHTALPKCSQDFLRLRRNSLLRCNSSTYIHFVVPIFSAQDLDGAVAECEQVLGEARGAEVCLPGALYGDEGGARARVAACVLVVALLLLLWSCPRIL